MRVLFLWVGSPERRNSGRSLIILILGLYNNSGYNTNDSGYNTNNSGYNTNNSGYDTNNSGCIWLYDGIYDHTGWWYTYPSEKYEFVRWDGDIPN